MGFKGHNIGKTVGKGKGVKEKTVREKRPARFGFFARKERREHWEEGKGLWGWVWEMIGLLSLT